MGLLTIALSIMVLLTAEAASASGTFRCGNEIISIGDLKGKVLAQCGPPTSGDISETVTQGSFRGTTSPRGRERLRTRGSYGQINQAVETWYYNCGKNDFLYILTFQGGVLREIESGDYGSGEGDCSGAEARKSREEYLDGQPPSIPPQRSTEKSELKEPPTEGMISLSGSPAGAKAYIDGQFVCALPCTLRGITPGGHTLEISEEGYLSIKRQVFVVAGQTLAVMAELSRAIPDRPAQDALPSSADGKELYKWKDESGVIHITDFPPPN